jgi:metal-dependent amidase/aminoacylase/carboxypeptidase family protein
MIHPDIYDNAIIMTLACQSLDVEFFGKEAHAAAAPEQGINALAALILSFNAIDALRQHVKDKVRIHGIITDGGQAPNIVPERAACIFCVRAASESQLARLKERVLACFHAGAQATGGGVLSSCCC